MFNRYSEARIKTNKNNKVKYFKPTLYPDIPEKDTDILHYVKAGERLDILAHRYYGDVGLWWVISRANRLDPSDIGLDASSTIRIPQDISEVIRAFRSINAE
tara:strand:- start:135 stop:440 length:306 start_codon:yes stop_codon:yes gene_type:complete